MSFAIMLPTGLVLFDVLRVVAIALDHQADNSDIYRAQ